MNEAGGINGLNVELAVRDTAHVPDTHVQMYESSSPRSSRSGIRQVAPHHGDQPVVAGRWNPCHPSDLVLGLVRPCHQRQPRAACRGPYCIEAMNMIEYLTLQDPEATTIAIATNGGDYGLDSSAGALMVAEALGLEVVYDGSGVIVATDRPRLPKRRPALPGREQTWSGSRPIRPPSAGSTGRPWLPASPVWSGADRPGTRPGRFDSLIAEPLANDFYVSAYYAPWAVTGNQMVCAISSTRPVRRPRLLRRGRDRGERSCISIARSSRGG